jgi:hypothetical protein
VDIEDLPLSPYVVEFLTSHRPPLGSVTATLISLARHGRVSLLCLLLLATGLHSPRSLAATVFQLIWSDDQGIWSISQMGGAPTQLVAEVGVGQVLVIDEQLYWSNDDLDEIRSLSMVGGASTPQTVVRSGHVAALAADSRDLYWIAAGVPSVTLMKASLDGSDVLLLDSESVDTLPAAPSVSVDGQDLYWTTNDRVKRVSKVGVADVADNNDGVTALLVTSSEVYWSSVAVISTGGVPTSTTAIRRSRK